VIKKRLYLIVLALALVLLAVGGWIADAVRSTAGHGLRGLLGSRHYGRGGSKMYRLKLLVALAAASAFASVTVVAALAGGVATVGTKVAIAKSRIGTMLVDGKGITLYDFVQDKGTKSTCYGACAALWPPLLTKGKPVAGRGVRAALLGTTKRKDGKLEVTYNGHPLYYFVTDRKPGQTTGQGVNQFGAPWWVLSPAGKEIHRV
jgi:predicted lipoprotein with Yx(FWY)xxD motif